MAKRTTKRSSKRSPVKIISDYEWLPPSDWVKYASMDLSELKDFGYQTEPEKKEEEVQKHYENRERNISYPLEIHQNDRTDFLRSYGFLIEREKGVQGEDKNVYIHEDIVRIPSMESVFNFYLDLKDKRNHWGELFQETTREHIKDAYSEGYRDDFTGISYGDCVRACEGDYDLSKFIKGRKNAREQADKLRLKDVTSWQRRNRFQSEHDGDFDFDKRFEIKPFNSTVNKNNGIRRMVKVNVDFSFNCGISAEEIERYGIRVWSIIDIIESQGICCEVNYMWHSTGTYFPKESANDQYKHRQKTIINIKRSDEYVDIKKIARAFTPWFFRRLLFAMDSFIGDSINEKVCTGLGKAENNPFKEGVFPGEINLKINMINNGTLDHEKLNEFVKQSFQ